jgi:uncharacterized membrane protein YgdD (TMEM256/DUF423 family)
MRHSHTNLIVAISVTVLFFGSLLLASLTTASNLPIGALIGLGLLMLVGLAGWWMSHQVFKSL